MYVTKRNNTIEEVKFDKITKRLNNLIKNNEKPYINSILIAQKVVASIFSGITTEDLDIESANICINMCTTHYYYSTLAGRILISNLHKKTLNTFVEKEELIHSQLKLLNTEWLSWIQEYRNELNNIIDYERDYIFDYFGFKTLEHGYLLKINNNIIERPQDMIMRVSSFINCGNLELTKKTYELISMGCYIHASPTLFNSGINKSQLSSCFLLGTNDSLDSITKTWSDVSKISKWGGGIGIHISNIRAKDSLIKGTNGPSSGIIPMLKVYNEIARYVNQCFLNNTKIYTKQGLKRIDQIRPNDEVITHDGTLQKVLRIYCDNYKNTIIKIKLKYDYNYECIKVTPLHPFYVIKNESSENNIIINKLKNNLLIPEWIDAKDILKNDLIGFPIPTYELDNIYLDESDCYFYGLIIYNIIITTNYKLVLHNNKINEINFIKVYLVNNSINYKEKIINNLHIITWDFSSKFKFTKAQFFNIYNKKTIDDNLLHLPLHKVKWIIKGLINIKGSIKNFILLTIKSKNIIDSIKYICLRMGILCYTSYNKIKIPKTSYIADLLNIKASKTLNFIHYNNFLYTRLQQLSIENISSVVYDLEINNNSNYLTQIGLVHNGGKRKGSIAIYLEPHHPDILAFLDLRKNFGTETERTRDLFLALWVSNLFMKYVEEDKDWYLMCPSKCPHLSDVYGDEYEKLYLSYIENKQFNFKIKARDIMKAILISQIESGTPYIVFKDHVNNKSNQKNIGVIKSSNLCVHGDTKILTDNGYIEIKYLENNNINVWNGKNWSNVYIKKTGLGRSLIRINMSNGVYLDCTPEHIFYIIINDTEFPIQAQYLKKYDKLINFNLPDPFEFPNNIEYEDLYVYTAGYYCGDYKNNIHFIVPLYIPIKQRLLWLTGFCDNNNAYLNNCLILSHTNKNILLDIRLMLHTLGIESLIFETFEMNILYKLLINSNYVNKLQFLGFNPNIFKNNSISISYNDNIQIDIFVTSIELSYTYSDTFCFTEFEEHKGMFNGILTGQCAEILEYSDDKEYAVCNLGSIAINKFIIPFKNIYKWSIYTKNECKYCEWTKNFLINNNYPFTEKQISFEELQHITGITYPTYPQIYYGNKLIGGYNEFFKFIRGTFNYTKLYEVSYMATINLNNIIDINYYPVIETKLSNIKHRPIALGIQGLADTLVLLKIPFESEESLTFNKKMMETIYLACLTASCELSKKRYINMNILIKYGKNNFPEYYDKNLILDDININKIYHIIKPNKCELNNNVSTYSGAYSTFKDSPISKGIFQFDMWDFDRSQLFYYNKWIILEKEIKKYGVRNSLVTALMPTASTSQIFSNNECFEYFTNNIYSRRTLAGIFPVVNKYLINELINIGIWNDEMKQLILLNNGSISKITSIPKPIRSLFVTIWEIKQIWVLKNALARAPFVDQTQSMNIFIPVPDHQKLYSSHFWAWKNGLKTGIYYLRSKSALDATKVTIDPNIQSKFSNSDSDCINCSG